MSWQDHIPQPCGYLHDDSVLCTVCILPFCRFESSIDTKAQLIAVVFAFSQTWVSYGSPDFEMKYSGRRVFIPAYYGHINCSRFTKEFIYAANKGFFSIFSLVVSDARCLFMSHLQRQLNVLRVIICSFKCPHNISLNAGWYMRFQSKIYAKNNAIRMNTEEKHTTCRYHMIVWSNTPRYSSHLFWNIDFHFSEQLHAICPFSLQF